MMRIHSGMPRASNETFRLIIVFRYESQPWGRQTTTIRDLNIAKSAGLFLQWTNSCPMPVAAWKHSTVVVPAQYMEEESGFS